MQSKSADIVQMEAARDLVQVQHIVTILEQTLEEPGGKRLSFFFA